MILLYNVFTPTRNAVDLKACITVTRNTQVHERTRGYTRGGSTKI